MTKTTKPKTTKPALKKVTTLEQPNRLGHVVTKSGAHTLYLLETKVSDDYLPSFPEATVARIAAYDLSDPKKPARRGACDVKAAWWFVATTEAAYVLLARKVTEQSTVMDLAVLDLAEPHAPRLAKTLENVGAFGSDSKLPVLVVSGQRLVVSTRAEKNVRVFDLTKPLEPKPVGTVDLPDTPQAAFADDAGVLVTFLGNRQPTVELSWAGTAPATRELTGLGGSEKPARLGGTLFRATGDFNNSLGVFDAAGKKRSEKKLGPTSISVTVDGEHVVTFGDALSVWTPDVELVAKKNGVEGTHLTAAGGFICVPQRPDAKATDKRKAFAFDLWQLV
ncbi:MAG: hypothetical protein GQE15_29545 [Archangiaceae bacterium]|nr:hypothetical protein [Archangiaceae bacterium]